MHKSNETLMALEICIKSVKTAQCSIFIRVLVTNNSSTYHESALKGLNKENLRTNLCIDLLHRWAIWHEMMRMILTGVSVWQGWSDWWCEGKSYWMAHGILHMIIYKYQRTIFFVIFIWRHRQTISSDSLHKSSLES